MSKGKIVYFTYQKDFSESGRDRYFIYDGEVFSEVSSDEVVALNCLVVTHDFWLISSSLFKKHGSLPSKIVDVVLLSKISIGAKSIDGDVQPWDVSKTVKPLFKVGDDFDSYMDMYYRRKDLVFDVYMLFSHKLAEYFEQLSVLASNSGETERFYSLELPVFNMLTFSACRGIRVDNSAVRKHKDNLKLDFYRQLKLFAEKHKVLYELPGEEGVREKLSKLGYKVQDYSLEFLIDFLPSRDGYTDDLRSLQKANKAYRIFNSISYGSGRLRPIVESHWTSTSRIYHKSPSLQNIPKNYRDIFIPDEGMSLCYVDYDQFEVGIMAAISSDPIMKDIYENRDAYNDLAVQVFNDKGMRKKAKVMFLSYTYGMSLENIISAVRELGGDQKKAREYFSGFSEFEVWKESVNNEFFENGKIATISANYLNRYSDLELTDKEKRTSVNHVIQGTATFIFKRALLELSRIEGVQILIPMHDAVLFQHTNRVDPNSVVELFEGVMTKELSGKVYGKASIEAFYEKRLNPRNFQ
ncbi:DNA polymerase [Teredinibacter turnerae]|uniref:DNA polymerase n=1 Tax=Teredinibacter turnerae TaxID=2426 RepID=UPI00037D9BC7|nr:DNA polymerase [Teredinibacter turnerae]